MSSPSRKPRIPTVPLVGGSRTLEQMERLAFRNAGLDPPAKRTEPDPAPNEPEPMDKPGL